MIKVVVITPKKEIINDDFEFVLASGDNGQVGILENRIPVLLKITNGYVKLVNINEIFVAVSHGIVDSKDNIVKIVAQDAAIATTYEEAKQIIESNRINVIKTNKRKNVDFVEAEKELMRNIKEMKASSID